MPVTRMRADVVLQVGHRVRLDAPPGEDYSPWQYFVEENNGRLGTIVSFPFEYIGPLDREGRVPAAYFENGRVNVLFPGVAVPRRIKTQHLVFCDVTAVAAPGASAEHEWAGDLPFPIQFWPGDMVCCVEETGEIPRAIHDLRFAEDGAITYVLSDKNKTESDGRNLKLLHRGNVFFLYNDPGELSFDSPNEELLFWSQKGISEPVFGKKNERRRYEWPLEEARSMVQNERGDLILHAKSKVLATGRDGEYQIFRLHDCFEKHRSRVRKLALANPLPLAKETSLDEDTAKMLNDLIGAMKG